MTNEPKHDKSRLQSRRPGRNTFVTKSGQTIKIHQNLGQKLKATRDARAQQRASRLAGMPKTPVKRFFYRLHPKRLWAFWASREGGIMALKLLGIGIIVGFLVIVGVFAYFRKDLPNLKDISGKNIGGSIRYYDKTGQTLLWEDYDAVKRIPVQNDNISQYLKDATVAVEDRDFFSHGGFDVRGIARAAVNDVVGSGPRQGGSTITQQLVKLNNNWTNDKTYIRKVKELILAIELERSYNKQEILTGYLNAAPYGNVQYGAEAATRDYFNKSAKDLTLDEAAFMAAIPKSPSYYSPYGAIYKQDPTASAKETIGRRDFILGIMLETGKIDKNQFEEAKKVDTLAKVQTPKPKYSGIQAPHFVLTAKEELESRFGAETTKTGGWKVTTTLDTNLQKIAEEQVAKGAVSIKRYKANQIGFAVEDVKTGQMVALVGSTDFNNDSIGGQNNYARLKIPPGSSIKPYDYAALFENTTNTGAGSVFYDTKGALPGYPCTISGGDNDNCAKNYDRRYHGPVTVRYALGGSLNVPAIKAVATVGIDKVQETAKNLMKSPGTAAGEARGEYNCYSDEASTKEAPCYNSAALGDGAYLRLDEHVHGYASLSRNGLNIPQTYILKIEDSSGRMVDEWKPSKGFQAVRQDTAYIISDMLSDPNASYFRNKPHTYKGHKFGLKTGTTNDNKDALMMMMSTQYAAGVWVGWQNRTVAFTTDSGTLTVPIISGFMQKAHDGLKPEERAKPSTVKTLPAFIQRASLGNGEKLPGPSQDLFPSWYQSKKTSRSNKTIDQVSNKLATDCTPSRARKDISDTNANQFSADKFVQGGAAAAIESNESDDIHKCDDARPAARIIDATSSSLSVQVSRGTHALSSAQFPGSISVVIDGQTIQSYPVSDANSGQTMTLNYSYSGTGAKDVQVVIVDSVLYDASDSMSVTFGNTGGNNGGNSTNVKLKRTGNTFSWTGASGTVSVIKVSNNTTTTICSGGTAPVGSCTANASGGGSFFARDSLGDSDPIN